MNDMTYSQMKLLENMLQVYVLHCSDMQKRWHKSASYHDIFRDWQEKKVKAQRLIQFLLEGDTVMDSILDNEEVHGDDSR